jgi:hypothetical protein
MFYFIPTGHQLTCGFSAGITSIVKTTQLPEIGFANLTESTTPLVILGTAEGAITIIAASIPILRALLRDNSPMPPGPAQFYHIMDTDMYTGTANTRGTGRSNTVITAGGGDSGNRSIASTRWSKDVEGAFFGLGPLTRLSRLSQLSGLSFGLGSANRDRDRDRDHGGHNRTISIELQPPPGKILQTEEVVVEYEPNRFINIGRAI